MEAFDSRTRLDVITEEEEEEEERKKRRGGEDEGVMGNLQQQKDLRADLRMKLSDKILEMENFAGNLEEIFVTVEESFARREQTLEQHSSDVLLSLSQRSEARSAALLHQKECVLERLYAQLLHCGQALDTHRQLIERAQALHRQTHSQTLLQTAGPIIKRMVQLSAEEQEPLLLEDSLTFDSQRSDEREIREMMETIHLIPAPSAPVVNPQLPDSAGETSLLVCWSLFSDDTVEFYTLYWRLIDCSPGAPPDHEHESRVKETHCTVSHLLPNTQYELWVCATNTSGTSPASERAVYTTVPSPPLIKPQECVWTVDAALIRWDSGNTNPVESYTVEIMDQKEQSGVNECVLAVPSCECVLQLKPWRKHTLTVRAVNTGGSSRRSLPLEISTSGTFLRLLERTAHPALSISLSDNGWSMSVSYQDEDLPLSLMSFSESTFTRCVAVLGELVPISSRFYWEVDVEEDTDYRIGVAYENTPRNTHLGAHGSSWCMRHTLTPSRHKFEFLHEGCSPDVRVASVPLCVGVYVDHTRGILSFFNATLGQRMHTFHTRFLESVCACFALERPGHLRIRTGLAPPTFTSHT